MVKSRDLLPNKRVAIRTYLREVNIPEFTNSVVTCTEKASLLETIITTSLDMVLHYNHFEAVNDESYNLYQACQDRNN